MASNDLHIRVLAEPVAWWFITGCLTVFGAMCLPGFINRMHDAGPDEYALAVMGTLCLWAAIRTYGYFTHPNLSVTSDGLVYRPFWARKRRLAFKDIRYFVFSTEDIGPRNYLMRRSGARTGRLLTIRRLKAVPKSGKPNTIVLPSFSQARIQAILSVISRNSSCEIRHA